MALIDTMLKGARAADAMAAALNSLRRAAGSRVALTIEPHIPDAALDRALADAAERGQLPQTMRAIRGKVG